MSRYIFAVIVECDERDADVLQAMYTVMAHNFEHTLRAKVIEMALPDNVPGEPTVVLLGAM